jgi:hypothetical protein
MRRQPACLCLPVFIGAAWTPLSTKIGTEVAASIHGSDSLKAAPAPHPAPGCGARRASRAERWCHQVAPIPVQLWRSPRMLYRCRAGAGEAERSGAGRIGPGGRRTSPIDILPKHGPGAGHGREPFEIEQKRCCRRIAARKPQHKQQRAENAAEQNGRRKPWPVRTPQRGFTGRPRAKLITARARPAPTESRPAMSHGSTVPSKSLARGVLAPKSTAEARPMGRMVHQSAPADLCAHHRRKLAQSRGRTTRMAASEPRPKNPWRAATKRRSRSGTKSEVPTAGSGLYRSRGGEGPLHPVAKHQRSQRAPGVEKSVVRILARDESADYLSGVRPERPATWVTMKVVITEPGSSATAATSDRQASSSASDRSSPSRMRVRSETANCRGSRLYA